MWDNYPGAPVGGQQQLVNLANNDWLPNNSPRLAGNVAHVFKDVNDDNVAEPSEEVAPSGNKSFVYHFTPFNATACARRLQLLLGPRGRRTPGRPTPTRPPSRCSTSSTRSTTTSTPRRSGSPARPATSRRSTATRSTVNALDGADTAAACPTATTSTTPTWHAARRHRRRGCRCTCSTSRARRSRTATRSSPATPATRPTSSTTSTPTACPTAWSSTPTASPRWAASRPARWARRGATCTPWTSWSTRAVHRHRRRRRPPRGRVRRWGNDLIRTQPMDCPVGSTLGPCHGTPGAGPGGYTYGDFGKVFGGPEVHADGEIWARRCGTCAARPASS